MSDKATMQQGSTPVPDPTILTTEQLKLAIENSEKFVLAQLDVLKMDLDGYKSQRQVRDDCIKADFAQIENWRKEQKEDVRKALSDTLTAAQTAADKSEKAIAEQIKQLAETARVQAQSLNSAVDELKERVLTNESVKERVASLEATVGRIPALESKVTVIEATKSGATENRIESRQGNAALYATVGFVFTIILFAITVGGILLAANK